jgi:hypothetical protein
LMLTHGLGPLRQNFGLVFPGGNPKYVNGIDPNEQPKVLARTYILCFLVLMNTIIDME